MIRNSTQAMKNMAVRYIHDAISMAHAAAAAQFDVRIAEPDNHTDMTNFARLVNSADVMVGVHGADLTKLLFLRPRRAALVASWGGAAEVPGEDRAARSESGRGPIG